MADVVAQEAYAEQLAALLPQGRAWAREGGSTLRRLLDAEAGELALIDCILTALLDDIRPATTTTLLTDWERALGLPDECFELGATHAERVAAVVYKAVTLTDLSAATYVAVARRFGATIVVREHDQALAEAIPGLDTSGGKWRFVWWITIDTGAEARYFDMLSHVDTPLLRVERHDELECLLRRVAPAHTHLVIGYEVLS